MQAQLKHTSLAIKGWKRIGTKSNLDKARQKQKTFQQHSRSCNAGEKPKQKPLSLHNRTAFFSVIHRRAIPHLKRTFYKKEKPAKFRNAQLAQQKLDKHVRLRRGKERKQPEFVRKAKAGKSWSRCCAQSPTIKYAQRVKKERRTKLTTKKNGSMPNSRHAENKSNETETKSNSQR